MVSVMTMTISESMSPPQPDHMPIKVLSPPEKEGRRRHCLMTPVITLKTGTKAIYFAFLVTAERGFFSSSAICASSFFICAAMLFTWGSSAGFFTREPMSE